MISDEAVEVVARELNELAADQCVMPFEGVRDQFEAEARRILEAAAPHMQAYPHSSGDCTVIGPECFTNESAEVICYKGVNYYRSHP